MNPGGGGEEEKTNSMRNVATLYRLDAAEFSHEWTNLSSMEKFKLMKSDKLCPIIKSPIRTWKAKRQYRPRRDDMIVNSEAEGAHLVIVSRS